jgi:hypothetical protein
MKIKRNEKNKWWIYNYIKCEDIFVNKFNIINLIVNELISGGWLQLSVI